MARANPQWIVHKFGGSSLAGVDEFSRVGAILDTRDAGRRAVVVSAVKGVTDRLLDLVDVAAGSDPRFEDRLEQLRDTHLALAKALLDAGGAEDYRDWLAASVAQLGEILKGVSVLGTASPDTSHAVVGYGELWSSRLLFAARKKCGINCRWLDARKVLIVGKSEMGPVVQWAASGELLQDFLGDEQPDELIITGFIASTTDGLATTLGRDGSDFSASIFGRLLAAGEVCIWTDVDGVMSADPRLVPDARVIPDLSYDEAVELAYFGARILHPGTMTPAIDSGIPLRILNTFNPQHPGTRISTEAAGNTRIKGMTTIDDVTLFNLGGTGLIGVPGTAHRLFGALRKAEVSVILISQGSSEHSICFVVRRGDADEAQEVVQRAFRLEIDEGQVHRVERVGGVSILAIVGNGMAGIPGVAGKLFSTLGQAGVNVRAIAQGSSERNISIVIDSDERRRAVRAVHSGFYLSPQTLSIGLVGPGNIGAELLDQLAAEKSRLQANSGVDLRVRGLLSSDRMWLVDDEIDLQNWRADWARQAVDADMAAFAEHVHAEHLPHAVLIDCSASRVVASRYAQWLAAGIHVITPNKKACTDTMSFYRELADARRRSGAHFLYETTVGAGLPIIQTVRDLVHTGDTVHSISGIFSGTLAYLFNRFDGRQPFSEIVREAREKGLTEPDPRDDLSGMDVARKLVILARELGLETELESVAVESLVPESLAEVSVDEFMAAYSGHDHEMQQRYEAARIQGKVLRYVGRLEPGAGLSVSVQAVEVHHPFANISLTDNVVQFVTHRYADNPLIVQGPGAGPAVTAGGAFADLLRLCAYLGARL